MKLILILSILILLLGIIEKKIYLHKLQQIPLKIYVNGTRGKSSTTRLIAGALREAGYQVLAKTTGSAARFIMPDGSERKIKRRGMARIKEQMKGSLLANKHQVDVLVMECMAISPEMQWVSENEMVQSDIGIITNVHYDHLDKMGHTLKEIAEVLALTIPKNGDLITGETKHLSIFKKTALQRNTKLHPINPTSISDQELNNFAYPVFKENIACALQVSSLLNINQKVALAGMKKTTPDVGALKILSLTYQGRKIYLINAFATNDYSSTIKAWQKCKNWYQNRDIFKLPLIGLFNHRSDRSYRLNDLAKLTNNIKLDKLIIIGSLSGYLIEQKINNSSSSLTTKKYSFLFSITTLLDDIIATTTQDVLLFGFGNIKGSGEKILDYFEENGDQYANC